MTVRIVTDSACDLTEAEAEDMGIEVVPLSIRFGQDEYTDRTELDVDGVACQRTLRANLIGEPGDELGPDPIDVARSKRARPVPCRPLQRRHRDVGEAALVEDIDARGRSDR